MKSLHQVVLLPERVPHLAPRALESRRREVEFGVGTSPRAGTSLQSLCPQLRMARGLLRSLPLPAPASKFVDQDASLRAGAEPRCGMSCCLRFVWSGCRRSLPLPALVLYSLKQHFPLSFLIPNASKYLQELQWTLQHLIKTYAMQKGN
ncbi:hypothetical protein F2Q68_00041336 [Brassica cretica]|uniref:Uncharacterized protein n=1 Tax=Brassica cretica TaxID=69181 RepID=A0A8S9MKY6_BRACR|nr:hypothetical protein F2Q68_00041336 [Brassica cretica]